MPLETRPYRDPRRRRVCTRSGQKGSEIQVRAENRNEREKLGNVELGLQSFDQRPVAQVDLISEGGF